MISPVYCMHMLPDMILNHNRLHSMGQPLKTERLVTSESCHDANFAVTSVLMTTSDATRDVKVGIVVTPGFQWLAFHCKQNTIVFKKMKLVFKKNQFYTLPTWIP